MYHPSVPHRVTLLIARIRLSGQPSCGFFVFVSPSDAPFCEILLYHTLGLGGGPNFRWQYTLRAIFYPRYEMNSLTSKWGATHVTIGQKAFSY